MDDADRVMLAPPGGHRGKRVLWRVVDSAGCVLMDGDRWMVVRDPDVIARILWRVGCPGDVSQARVLAELNLQGHWPTVQALRDYLDAA